MRTPLLVVCAVCLSSIAALAQDHLPHVTVYGTAVTQVAPDMLRWHISIKNTGAEVEPVAFEHANTVASTLRFLKDQKIPSDKIQTSQMSISEHHEYRDNSMVREGYDASTDITFSTTDLPAYRALWHGLSKIRGISVRGADWDTTRRIEIQDSTRVDALKAARSKAETMATTLGVKIGEPIAIEEPSGGYGDITGNSVRQPATQVAGGEDDPIVAPGAIEIRVRVLASFRIVAP